MQDMFFLNLLLPYRPLQKMTTGGVLAGLSFVVAGLLELNLEVTFCFLNYFKAIL